MDAFIIIPLKIVPRKSCDVKIENFLNYLLIYLQSTPVAYIFLKCTYFLVYNLFKHRNTICSFRF